MEGHCDLASILGYPDGTYGSKLWIRDSDDTASNIHETDSQFQYSKGKISGIQFPDSNFPELFFAMNRQAVSTACSTVCCITSKIDYFRMVYFRHFRIWRCGSSQCSSLMSLIG